MSGCTRLVRARSTHYSFVSSRAVAETSTRSKRRICPQWTYVEGLLGTGYSCFTILGDPQAHYAYRFSEIARSANFKNQSDKQEQYAKFVQAKMLRNPLATELNLHSHEDVLRFMSVELPMFRLILLAERLEESLVVLRHYLKWTYEDVLYLEPTW
ncbi:hypothetical protein CYMTET_44011 [Cymbomonas tetramitiformis]|uniref:Uncharacterized protein n=2 Tax=Cymbomonas tetramitiformis TaxID=36881 RepID=A0AAE0C120_9CHLO|nr:hypothetical protein CYMTET_44011 [Cymbomonas tetramitiformis]